MRDAVQMNFCDGKIAHGVLLFLMFFLMSTIHGAYLDGDVLLDLKFNDPQSLASWTVAGAKPKLADGAVEFKTNQKSPLSLLSLELDPKKISGTIVLQANIKGITLKAGEKPYWGPKVMLMIETEQRKYFPEPQREFGTYDWKTVKMYFSVPANVRKMSLVIGLQQGQGTFYVRSLKINRAIKDDNVIASSSVPPELKDKAQAIPRGIFTGTNYRGVMSGKDLSPTAFAELERWGVNLIRYQLNPDMGGSSGFKDKINSRDGYLAWIDFEVARFALSP